MKYLFSVRHKGGKRHASRMAVLSRINPRIVAAAGGMSGHNREDPAGKV